MTSCSDLLAQNKEAWAQAVRHPFLEECRAGTINENSFDAWLVQDFFFAREFVRFGAALLNKAPHASFDLLLGGMAALQDELRWFQALAAERKLHLDCLPHPTCQRYIQFMDNASKQPHAVHAVAFWAIERAYHEAWSSHMPMAQPYQKYAERWGSDGFGAYVKGLGQQADVALQAASEQERREAQAVFFQVCQLEREFWEMAYSATAFE